MLVMPKAFGADRSTSQFSPELLQVQLDEARRWRALSPGSVGGGTGRYICTDGMRGTGGGFDPTLVSDPTDQGGG